MSLRIFSVRAPAVGTSVLLHVAAFSAMWLASGSIQVPEPAISAQLIADVQSAAGEKGPPAPAAQPQLEPPTPTRYVVTQPEPPKPARDVVAQPEPPKPARYVKPFPAPPPTPVATASPIQRSIPVEPPLPIETPPPIEAPMPKADAKPVVAKVEPPGPAPGTRGPEAARPAAAAAAPAALAAAPMSNVPAASGPLAPAGAPMAPAASGALGTRHGAPGGAATAGSLVAALPVTQTATPRGGYQLTPTYPSSARRAGIQGTTLLGIFVGADGRVADVVVKQSAGHPDLDRAATEAVRRWRFEPARRGGEAVAMWIELPVEFHLR
jgi:periplasmic protein TonB